MCVLELNSGLYVSGQALYRLGHYPAVKQFNCVSASGVNHSLLSGQSHMELVGKVKDLTLVYMDGSSQSQPKEVHHLLS